MSKKRLWGTLDPFLESGDILGRKVANASFLKALLRRDPFDEYHFFLESAEQCESLEERLHALFPEIAARNGFVLSLQQNLPKALETLEYEAFHLSDCFTRFAALVGLRNALSRRLFPITAPTHSLSYERFMPAYLALLSPGTSVRDAVVVTSRSAASVLNKTFSLLEERFGLPASFRRPELPLVPLGTDAALFTEIRHEDGGERALALRKKLGAGEGPVFLCLARLSPASKMDLLPALAAMRRALDAGLTADSLFVAAGWTEEGDPLPDALRAYAESMGVRFVPVPRPSDEDCRLLMAAADVFLSPSDNIQETFGLTLAEAGAAGLPVVASDFDGYRDIVLHEETGLLVPTLGFADSAESSALAGIWKDNQYHLKLAQQTAVDVPALAEALLRLGANRELRRNMGRAGRERAKAVFDWSVVIPQYEKLWEDLNAVPLAVGEEAALRSWARPLSMDFAKAFQGHFTETLTPETAQGMTLARTARGDALYQGKLPILRYAGLEGMLDEEAVRRILLAARKPANAADLLAAAKAGMDKSLQDSIARERAGFALLWCLKQDYLERR